MYPALGVSASGLAAQRLRMDVIANNLANVDSTIAKGEAYRRKMVVLTEAPNGAQFRLPVAASDRTGGASADMHGVAATAVVEDTTPLRRVFEPGNPLADQFGYVTRPNVNPITEMVDMVAASRSYQSNVTAFEATKSMAKEALRLLR